VNVKTLRDKLAEVPDDYEVEIGRFMAMDIASEHGQLYQIKLDFPMTGIAVCHEGKELAFITSGDGAEELCWLLKFGEVSKFGDKVEDASHTVVPKGS
jgi:hypothetical protein